MEGKERGQEVTTADEEELARDVHWCVRWHQQLQQLSEKLKRRQGKNYLFGPNLRAVVQEGVRDSLTT